MGVVYAKLKCKIVKRNSSTKLNTHGTKTDIRYFGFLSSISNQGEVYIKDHEIAPCWMAFYHGHTSWPHSPQFLRFVGSSLCVDWMWTKRNDHSPQSECADFFNIYPKRQFWDFVSCFMSFSFFSFSFSFLFILLLPFFPCNDNNVWPLNFILLKEHFLSWSLDLCKERTSLPLSPQNPLDHNRG